MPANPLAALCLAVWAASAPAWASGPAPTPCSEAWARQVEARLPTGDGQGHGPDRGSDEWKGVIEFRLGVRGQADLPPRDSVAWCTRIDALLAARRSGNPAPQPQAQPQRQPRP